LGVPSLTQPLVSLLRVSGMCFGQAQLPSEFFLALILVLVIVQLFQVTIPKVSLAAYSQFVRPLQRLKPMGKFQSLSLGLLTPLIPCGQLWMVIGFSALATTPTEGAALAFGFSLFFCAWSLRIFFFERAAT
jgi:sulfite exporter TauE/SafE